MICEATGATKDEMCIFGDRLYTDIALGAKNGVMSILVLTGEATVEDLDTSPADSLPTYVFDSLDDVNTVIFGD